VIIWRKKATKWTKIGLKLNALEKTLGAGEKLEDFETHFRINESFSKFFTST
jgi:hypothetical protein